MNHFKWLAVCLLVLLMLVYLFATAPPPLATESAARTVPIQRVIEILKWENDVARALYTKAIVGDGKKQGIKFNENWADEKTQAGLLPAQFLRETARFIEQTPVPLGLFLGSDNAINSANGFNDEQLRMYEKVKQLNQPLFQYDKSISRYSYMFPDVAVAHACVQCHNNHVNSPKKDWKLWQIMGATTWTYPQQTVSVETAIQMIVTLRQGFRSAYELTLDEARQMKKPPLIGDLWPARGLYLPSADIFMKTLSEQASAKTLSLIMKEAANEN